MREGVSTAKPQRDADTSSRQARAHAAARKPAAEAAATGRIGSISPADLLALQRAAGNAAVSRTIGDAEHAPGCGHEHGDATPVQRSGRSSVHDILRSSGRPLAESVRTDMEARLGADFSDVRLHTGSAAKASASEMGARAYTSGNHIVIGEGGSDHHTLAHELTHVIQQRTGPVTGTENGSGLKISDPSDPFERAAEANAARIVAGQPPQVQRAAFAGQPTRQANASDQLRVQRADRSGQGERTGSQQPTYVRATMGRNQIQVRCERKTFGWLVYLPAGIDPAERASIARQLGQAEENIKFTNERHDRVTRADGASAQAPEKGKVGRSAVLVTEYLRSVGITSFDRSTVEKALGDLDVSFHDPDMWWSFVKGNTRGPSYPEYTEGLTTQGIRGQRSVGMNRNYYTLPAIVHELFHVLEHDSLNSLIPRLVEGITEYWASRATGVDYRCDRGNERIYKAELNFVKDALANHTVTEEQLRNGYFHGDVDALKELNNAYLEFQRKKENTSFAYTGGRR